MKDSIWPHQFDHGLLCPLHFECSSFFLEEIEQFGFQIQICMKNCILRHVLNIIVGLINEPER
jgi:hypothetical protein